VRENILVSGKGETAGYMSPPYGKGLRFKAGTETITEQVVWRDNLVLDEQSWRARRAELLGGRVFGPRKPWRTRLGMDVKDNTR